MFYRVEVRVQSAETTSVAKARSVLRRFSHFMKLFDKLREELGARTMVGKEPPPKRTLVNVNKRPDLIEARRRELEQWLWRLVSDPLVARSVVLNKFLELSVAAKLVEQALAAQRALGIDTGLAAVSNEESGASDAAGPAAMGLASEFYSEDGASTHWGDAASTVTDAYYSPSTSAYWGNGQRGGFADQAGRCVAAAPRHGSARPDCSSDRIAHRASAQQRAVWQGAGAGRGCIG